MRKRESMGKLRIYGKVHSQYMPREEIMHFLSRISMEQTWQEDLSMAGCSSTMFHRNESFSHLVHCKYHFTFSVMSGWLLSVVEARREGPKPLINCHQIYIYNKTNQNAESTGEEDSRKHVVGSWHLTKRAPSQVEPLL